MFDILKFVDWIFKIMLSKNREEQIASCFKDTKISFNYPSDINDFKALIEYFQRETENDNDNGNAINDNILGEKKNLTNIFS